MPQDTKKNQILDAAQQLLLTHGPKKVNLDDIASQIGVSKTALYHYFPSKEAIFRATIQRVSRHVMEEVERAVERAPTPAEKLSAMFRTRFRTVEKIQDQHRLSLDQVMEMGVLAAEAKFVLLQAEFDLVEQILHDGQVRGAFQVEDPKTTAEVVVLSLRGLEEHLFVRRAGAKVLLEQFEAMILDGLRSR